MIDMPSWERERRFKRLVPLLVLIFAASAIIISYELGKINLSPDLTGAVTADQKGFIRDRGIVKIDYIQIGNYRIPHPTVSVGLSNDAQTDATIIFTYTLIRTDNGKVLDKGIREVSVGMQSEGVVPILFNTDYLGEVKVLVYLYSSEAYDATASRVFTTRTPSEDNEEVEPVPEAEPEQQCDCSQVQPPAPVQEVQYSPPSFKWVYIIALVLVAMVAIGLIIQFLFVKKRFALEKFVLAEKDAAPKEGKRIRKEVFEEKIRSIQDKLK